MEINKDQPNENRLSLYTEFTLTGESDTVSLHSAFYRGSKAAGEQESFMVEKREGRPQVHPD